MSIDLHDPVSVGHEVADRARKRAGKTVEAARDVDLHAPAQAAKKVAKRAAKEAGKRAARGAARAGRTKAKRGSRRALRVVILAVVLGAGAGIAVSVIRRRAAQNAYSPLPADSGPDPFGREAELARELAGRTS
jgi:hypothetical protein